MCDPSRDDSSPGLRRPSIALEDMVGASRIAGGVARRQVRPGDRLIVSTKNSIYSLTACADGRFVVRGGWYEREGRRAARLEVLGCTAGGRALYTHLVAAPGLFLELSDGTLTTRIKTVRVLRASGSDSSGE